MSDTTQETCELRLVLDHETEHQYAVEAPHGLAYLPKACAELLRPVPQPGGVLEVKVPKGEAVKRGLV